MSDVAMSARIVAGSAPSQRGISEEWVATALIALLITLLVVIIALPLLLLFSKSVQDASGAFVGFHNFVIYFTTPTLAASLVNSVLVALSATVIVIPLAFGYAYALTRTCMRGKGFFYAAALLPVFAPSLLSAISFIYIFGNQGFLKDMLMGASIYGPIGIVLAESLYCFPHALLILVTALSLADGRLYEAATVLGARPTRVFRTVTLPGASYGLISAAFVVFTLVITDFGIPKVIGGQFNVLATDAYKQVIGQQNFSMGAVVGMILICPAVLAFAVDRHTQRRQVALLSARAVPYEPKPNRGADSLFTLYCLLIAGCIVATYGVAVWASLIRYWPYNLTMTLDNYDFSQVDPGGWQPYVNSVIMAALTATIGTTIVFTGAFLTQKIKVVAAGRAFVQFLAMLPMAVPGLVLGLGYVFFVNAPWNPLNILYGTLAVLVVNTIAHFYTVSHITAVTALKQIDSEFESVSASLKVPFWRTFRRVTAPICMPAILDIGVYMFVNAMTTVSAAIFLYGPGTKLASIAVVHMDEAGAAAPAAAMGTMIMATAILAKLLQVCLNSLIFTRLQAWRKR